MDGEGRWQGRACALLLAASLLFPLLAQSQAVSPGDVKAAFVFRFASFVEWPAASRVDQGALVFGVADASDVEEELRRYASLRAINGRRPEVRRVETPADLAGVHVLFIGGQDPGRISRWIAGARQHPILTVTDAPDGLERGSILNFVTTDRVQFEASTGAANRAGVRLNARLLSVAMRVKKGEAGEPVLLARRRGSAAHPGPVPA